MSDGFVYVVCYKEFCKVGFSCNPEHRIMQLTKSSAIRGYTQFISDYKENASELESIIHQRLMSKNIGGEWFKVSISEVLTLISDIEKGGYDKDDVNKTKKPRVPVIPHALKMLEFICDNSERDLYFLDNKSKVLADIILKEFLAVKDKIKKVNR